VAVAVVVAVVVVVVVFIGKTMRKNSVQLKKKIARIKKFFLEIRLTRFLFFW
jgi:hypothetical protein